MLASLTFKPKFDISEDSQNKEMDEKDRECCSRVVNIENWKNRKYIDIWHTFYNYNPTIIKSNNFFDI